jgi:Ca2+/H+ antiporter, TMEM165/GDT1 family
MSAFLVSFALIFFAELGDKSQLMAMWLATRHRWWLVVLGVSISTVVLNLIAVAVGTAAADLIPEAVLLIGVGLLFFAFAAWGLRVEPEEEGEELVTRGTNRLGSLGLIATAFFVAEFGDKTQLATMSLAADQGNFFAVWLGSTLGIIAAASLAIAVGVFAGKRLPARTASIIAAVLFAVFGTLALARAAVLIFDL